MLAVSRKPSPARTELRGGDRFHGLTGAEFRKHRRSISSNNGRSVSPPVRPITAWQSGDVDQDVRGAARPPLGWDHIALMGDYDWNSGAAERTNVRPLNLYSAKIRWGFLLT